MCVFFFFLKLLLVFSGGVCFCALFICFCFCDVYLCFLGFELWGLGVL